MPLPIHHWWLYSNGFPLDLYLSFGVTPVTGTITPLGGGVPTDIQEGTWDEGLSQITFERVVLDKVGNPTGEVQTYVGFLFDQEVQVPGHDPKYSTWTMAGTFTSTGGGEYPPKAAAGWGWFASYGGESLNW